MQTSCDTPNIRNIMDFCPFTINAKVAQVLRALSDNKLSLIQRPQMMANTYPKYDELLKPSGAIDSIDCCGRVTKSNSTTVTLFIGSFLGDVKYLSVCLFVRLFLVAQRKLRNLNRFTSHRFGYGNI